jgi:hypothetical protein
MRTILFLLLACLCGNVCAQDFAEGRVYHRKEAKQLLLKSIESGNMKKDLLHDGYDSLIYFSIRDYGSYGRVPHYFFVQNEGKTYLKLFEEEGSGLVEKVMLLPQKFRVFQAYFQPSTPQSHQPENKRVKRLMNDVLYNVDIHYNGEHENLHVFEGFLITEDVRQFVSCMREMNRAIAYSHAPSSVAMERLTMLENFSVLTKQQFDDIVNAKIGSLEMDLYCEEQQLEFGVKRYRCMMEEWNYKFTLLTRNDTVLGMKGYYLKESGSMSLQHSKHWFEYFSKIDTVRMQQFMGQHNLKYQTNITLYDDDLLPFRVFNYGFSCGHMHSVKEHNEMEEMAQQKDYFGLYQWATSMNPELQAFGTVGMFMLNHDGIDPRRNGKELMQLKEKLKELQEVIYTEEEKEAHKKVLQHLLTRTTRIYECGGCLGGLFIPMNEVFEGITF